MDTKDLIEKLSEKVHDAWMKEKAAQGFHAPNDCPNMGKLSTAMCKKCHTDMYPYEELPENIKDYDRVTVNAVLQALDDLGIKLKESTQKTGLNFGQALEQVKHGKGMRLPAWQSDVVIRAQYPDENSKMTSPYLYVESRFGRVPWKETMIELFSEQWEIVD